MRPHHIVQKTPGSPPVAAVNLWLMATRTPECMPERSRREKRSAPPSAAPVYTRSSAWARSPTRSCPFSIPTESRTNPSSMPSSLSVPLHSDVQGLEAAQRQEAVQWPRDGADRVREEGELLVQVVAAQHQRASHHVTVAVEGLRHAMRDDVETELERALEERR